jgi:CRP-like cAMP-binding protein
MHLVQGNGSPSPSALGLLRQSLVWADVADATLTRLLAGSRVIERAAGQVFVVADAPAGAIYLLSSGAARAYYPARRTHPEATTRLILAPGSFNEIACATQRPNLESVEALVPSTAIAIDPRTYFLALQREPAAAFRSYFDLAQRLACASDLERSAYGNSVPERVIALLLAYARQAGGDIRLSQDDIAQQVGSTRRSVARVMERLYASGGLERRGHRYAVVDRQKLLALATGWVADMISTQDQRPWVETARRS